NSFTYDPIPESFNEVQIIPNPSPQSRFNIYLFQICESNSHYGYECSQRIPLVYEPEPCYNQNFGDNAYPHEFPGYPISPSLNIQNKPDNHELFISKLIQHKLQNEYAQPFSPIEITFDLPTVETKDSLRKRDEHFDTILEKESDEFIKSSVKNLIPSLSESEDLSDSECDVPACDDFTTFSNLLFDANNDFSSIDNDFSSNDNESLSDEDISKEIYSNPLFDEEIICIKIDPHHFNAESDLIQSLLNHDSSIISSSLKIDFLFDEFAGQLILLKSIPPGIDETNCDLEEEICLIEKFLYDNSFPRPPEEIIFENSDAAIESFSPSPIPIEDSDSLMEEIDLSFTLDNSMPPGIENDDYDSEGDILILEELLSNDSLSLPENESFHFNIPSSSQIDLSFTPDDPMPPGIKEDDYDSERNMIIFEELLSNDSLSLPEIESLHFDIPASSRPPAKPPDDDSGIMTVKMVGDISEHDVLMPRLLPTQPTLVSNQEKSHHLLSHQGFKASQLHFKSQIMIYGGNTPILDVPFLHFYPP
nr:hypothetical protein [Tanacetum cinerariifolium]